MLFTFRLLEMASGHSKIITIRMRQDALITTAANSLRSDVRTV